MSLNQIQLNPHMIADLYPNSLLETSTTTMPEIRETGKPLKYLGNNEKKIIVVVNHNHIPLIPDSELSFLTSILSACKLSLADIAITNFASATPDTFQELLRDEGRQILLFGIDPLSIGLPINFPQFQLQQFDQRTYLYGPSLVEVEKDKNLKMKLWACLKNLFGI